MMRHTRTCIQQTKLIIILLLRQVALAYSCPQAMIHIHCQISIGEVLYTL